MDSKECFSPTACLFLLSCSPPALPLHSPLPTALRSLLVLGGQGFQRPVWEVLALLQAAGSAKVQNVCCAGCPDRAGVGSSQAPPHTRSQKLPLHRVGHLCPSELASCPLNARDSLVTSLKTHVPASFKINHHILAFAIKNLEVLSVPLRATAKQTVLQTILH